MNTLPLITIGITAYNALGSIDAAIASAKAQSWPNTEIIIIDDCSTDGTWEHLQRSHAGLKLFQNPQNSGVAASRNQIIAKAAGKYIAFFDDDDTSAPERLQKQYERLGAQPGPTLCYTARRQNFPNGTQRIEPAITAHQAEAVAQRILYGKPLPGHDVGSFATCSLMAATETLKNLGGFDATFRRGEDTDLAIRAALANLSFVGIAEPLVTQIMTPASEKSLDEEYNYWMRLYDKHAKFLDANGQYNHARAWLSLKFKYYRGDAFGFIKSFASLLLRFPVLTAQRLRWVMPNLGFNMAYKTFQNTQAGQ